MSKVLVPDYFEEFHCKCGDCRHPCCDGWGINIGEHEYFRLLGIACSERLRHKLDDAFVVSENASPESYASIHPNYLEQCPMLDSDGLCLLQKEKGERIQPLICRVYPRAVKKYGSHHEICMSCSCEETVEKLMEQKTPLSLHEIDYRLPFDGMKVYPQNAEKDRIRHSAITMMSNGSIPLVERLGIIGNCVCEEPLKPNDVSRAEAIADVLRLLRLLCRGSRSLEECGRATLDLFDNADGGKVLSLFDSAERHLYRVIPDVEDCAGRMIANHMLYESFPFSPDCESPNGAFVALCTVVALMKLLTVGGMAKSNRISDFVDIVAFSNRFIEHSDFYKGCSRLDHPDGMAVYARFSPMLRKGKRNEKSRINLLGSEWLGHLRQESSFWNGLRFAKEKGQGKTPAFSCACYSCLFVAVLRGFLFQNNQNGGGNDHYGDYDDDDPEVTVGKRRTGSKCFFIFTGCGKGHREDGHHSEDHESGKKNAYNSFHN